MTIPFFVKRKKVGTDSKRVDNGGHCYCNHSFGGDLDSRRNQPPIVRLGSGRVDKLCFFRPTGVFFSPGMIFPFLFYSAFAQGFFLSVFLL